MKIRFTYSALSFVLGICFALGSAPKASAMIIGGKGDKPMRDHGWPTGAVNMANLKSRISWWEGPPFGGGQYHFEYRVKTTPEFNEALKVFSKIKAPELHLVVYDDTHNSFWLRDEKDPRLDWEFYVWIPANWHRLYNRPDPVIFTDHPDFRSPVPPPLINLHLGGSAIKWEDVKVPANVTVIDERSNTPEKANQNGGVVEGFLYDIASGRVIENAEVAVTWERTPKDNTKPLPKTTVDKSGTYRLEGIPTGRFKIVASAPGYSDRQLAATFQNRGKSIRKDIIHLSKTTSVSGYVTDAAGKSISEARISIREMRGIDGRGYIVPGLESAMTDEQGRFEIQDFPIGYFQLRSRKAGLHLVGFGFKTYETSAEDIRLVMDGTGSVKGKVKPKGKPERHVHLFPPEGEAIGKWSGSMRCQPDGGFEFKNVPAGKYRLSTTPGNVLIERGKLDDAELITISAGKPVVVSLD